MYHLKEAQDLKPWQRQVAGLSGERRWQPVGSAAQPSDNISPAAAPSGIRNNEDDFFLITHSELGFYMFSNPSVLVPDISAKTRLAPVFTLQAMLK